MGRLTGSDAKKLYELYDSIYEKKKDCVDKKDKGMHNCAKKVCHEEYGEGETIFSQHAEPDENGFVSHYNVQFEHGIVENVSVEDLEVLTMVEHPEHVEHDGEVVAEDAEEVEEGAANVLRAGLAAGTALAGGMLAKKAADVAGKIKEKQQKKSDMIKKTLGNSHELEGENLQEYNVQGAVKGALDKGAKFMKTNPVGKAVGAVLKPVGKGAGTVTKAQQQDRIKRNVQDDVDLFDIVAGYLIDEGHAETEEDAIYIMANMTDESRTEILDFVESMASDSRMKEIKEKGFERPARSREFEKKLPAERGSRGREFEHGSTRSANTPSGNLSGNRGGGKGRERSHGPVNIADKTPRDPKTGKPMY